MGLAGQSGSEQRKSADDFILDLLNKNTELDDRIKQLEASEGPVPIPSIVLVPDSAEVLISNSSAETTVLSGTVTGGTLGTTGLIKIQISATVVNSAGNSTLTWRVKYGGSTLLTVVPTVNFATTYFIVFDVWLRADGSASAQELMGIDTQWSGAFLVRQTPVVGTGAINSGIDQILEVTAQLSLASASNVFKTYGQYALGAF